ncbi:MAG: efflux RND transporter periplasmic adaptor subunit, partial [Thermoanaerobaculia bacterium]
PEIAGPVLQVLHRLGDPLKQGEPVIRLVDEHLRLIVEQKRILAAQARGKVQLADVARRECQEMVRQKAVRLEKARGEYERIQRLVENPARGLISREEADTKRYDLEQARSEHQTCLLQEEKSALEHAQSIEAEKLAQAELKTADYNLSQATLRSPIAGRISYLVVKPGELVSASTRVFSVVDTSRLEARLHVPQRELSRLREGLAVRILCEAFTEKEFRGSVEVVNPVVDRANGTVEVLVGVDDHDNFLRPGMFINGELVLDVKKDALLVPKKAISYEDREPIVYLVKDKVAHRYVVRPGYSTKDRIEILTLIGVNGEPADPADGRLVLIGHNNLKEGAKVEVE